MHYFPFRKKIRRNHDETSPQRSLNAESSAKSPLPYRPDIDGLRAVAILLVVFFHAFPDTLHGGFIGVDIFFVISGFLISAIILRGLEQKNFSFGAFYSHRIKRIFPALILVLTASFVVGWFALLPDEYKQLGKHMAAGSGFVQNVILWKESGYFDADSNLKPLLHLWSLSIEEQFYLLYPLLVWACWRARLNVRNIVLLLALMSFGLNAWWIQADAVKTFYLPQTRVWELLVGALCALAVAPPDNRFQPLTLSKKQKDVTSGLGLLLIVAAVAVLDKTCLFPGWWALLPVSGAALLLLSGPDAWVNQQLLSSRLLVWIGLISYPLYLWHWPLLSFAHIMAPDKLSPAICLALVALSFLLAWLTYRLVERPIRFGRKVWLIPVALVVVLVIDGLAGYNAFKRDGLSFRIPSNQSLPPVFLGNDDPVCLAADGKGLEFCRQSKAGQPTIFILGDSHAWHLFDGLAAFAAGTNEIVSIRAMGKCLGLSGLSFDPTRRDCAAEKNRIAAAAENDNVHTVIISARWDRYFDLTTPAAFEGALRETFTRLSNKKKHIIFVMDIPHLSFHPKYCLDIHLPLRSNVSSIGTCAVSRQEFNENTQHYRATVLRILHDYPAIQIFDPATLLCDDMQCRVMQDGKLLYRDYDHLSLIGSKYVAGWLWPLALGKDLPAPASGTKTSTLPIH